MSQRRLFSAVLLDNGLVTPDDIERALDYQRDHGGLFGQALVALGVLSAEQIEWALASHFELPYIFPDAAAIDLDAARLVPADWALAHLAVPILRAGSTLKVVVVEPLTQDVISELTARTGCTIELALASARRIRQLIHDVYAAQPQTAADETTMPLTELVAHALEHGADRFGLSLRGTTAIGWWHTRGGTQRALLAHGWQHVLATIMAPSPLEHVERGTGVRHEWSGTLERGSTRLPLDALAMVGSAGVELLFRPVQNVADTTAAADVRLPAGLITELRLLWRGGSARVGVTGDDIDAVRAALPMLPTLCLGEHVRALHINVAGEAGGAFALAAEADAAFVQHVAACGLDAITIDLPAGEYAVDPLIRAAPLCFVLLDRQEEAVTPTQVDVNWLLTRHGGDSSGRWDLRALHG
jgi:hypothetical protein